MLCRCFIYSKFNLRISGFFPNLVWYGGDKTGRFRAVVLGVCLSWMKFFLVFLLEKWVGFSFDCLILLTVNIFCWDMGKAGGLGPLNKTRGQIFVCCCDGPSQEIFLARVSLGSACRSLGKGDSCEESIIRRSVPSLSRCHHIGMQMLSSTAFVRPLNPMSWRDKGLLVVILFSIRDWANTFVVGVIAWMFKEGGWLFADVDGSFSGRHSFPSLVKSSKSSRFSWKSKSGWYMWSCGVLLLGDLGGPR